jgi:hypothetical protein
LCETREFGMGMGMGRKVWAGFPCVCAALGVPMSPELGNRHVCVPVPHGLISTERNTPTGKARPYLPAYSRYTLKKR